jgi:hypothetical protein
MENSYYLEKYAEMRHKDFVEAARLERLIWEAQEQKPKLKQKLTWQVAFVLSLSLASTGHFVSLLAGVYWFGR